MKNIVYCLLLILLMSCKDNDYFLLPYRVGDKWGLADTLGNIKVEPEYDEVINFGIEPFRSINSVPHSFYYVRKGKEIFFIDANNERYFEDYELVRNHTGDGVLFKKTGRWGYCGPVLEMGNGS